MTDTYDTKAGIEEAVGRAREGLSWLAKWSDLPWPPELPARALEAADALAEMRDGLLKNGSAAELRATAPLLLDLADRVKVLVAEAEEAGKADPPEKNPDLEARFDKTVSHVRDLVRDFEDFRSATAQKPDLKDDLRPDAGVNFVLKPDPSEARRSRAGTAANTTADSDSNSSSVLAQLLSKDRPPTIALIGNSRVGKTFFFERLNALAKQTGYKLDTMLDTGEFLLAEDVAKNSGSSWIKPIGGTRGFRVYSLRRRKSALWIIDLEGEKFKVVSKTRFVPSTAQPMSLDMRELWSVLSASQAFILMSPTIEALNVDTRSMEDVSGLIGPLNSLLNLLESQLKQSATTADAVAALSAMPSSDLRAAIEQQNGLVSKPLLLLLSKADMLMPLYAEAGVELDADPTGIVAATSAGTINQLSEWFAHFKIDFVTACYGHDDIAEVMDFRKPQYGIWEAITWARSMAGWRGRAPWSSFWRTAYAIRMRQILDGEFRRAMKVV